jgi:hypothetical protein
MLEDQTIADLKEKHGEIYLVEVGEDTEMIFKRPSEAEYKRFMTESADQDPQRRISASTAFVRANLLYPDKDVYRAYVTQYPAAVDRIFAELFRIIGADLQVRAKKL